MNAGRVLLALCAWIHFALAIWVCFLLPTHGDWVRKLDVAATTPLLLPLAIVTLTSVWLCRDRRLLVVTATMLATLDGLILSSRYWL